MRTRVVNLVGASGSGKDSVAKELVKRGYHDIPSYTTREPREEDEWGHTFIASYETVPHFNGLIIRSINEFNSFTRRNKGILFSDMIAYFNSYRSGNHYFATDDQVIRGKTNIYRVDPKGAEMVKDYYKDTDVEVITIYLEADEEIRKDRLLKRAKNKEYVFDKRDNAEVWERLRPDREIFSIIKCDYTVNANAKLEKVVDRVVQILEG